MHHQENNSIHNDILVMKCVLGKTVTTLGLVVTSTTQKMKLAEDGDEDIIYQPSLIILPDVSV